jgi:hypothetical protein
MRLLRERFYHILSPAVKHFALQNNASKLHTQTQDLGANFLYRWQSSYANDETRADVLYLGMAAWAN